jgi:predicted nucleotidyltransferase
MTSQVLQRTDVAAALERLHAQIARLGVRRLALFGSVQRGTARPDSDVDLLVEFAAGQKTLGHLVELGDLLEQTLQRHVELVTLESLSPYIGPTILEEAQDVVRYA